MAALLVLILVCVAGWLVAMIPCAILGYIVGSPKNAGFEGAFLGILFGPIGVIVAFAVDFRLRCPHCHGRLDGEPRVCPHCQGPILPRRPVEQPAAAVVLTDPEEERRQEEERQEAARRRRERSRQIRAAIAAMPGRFDAGLRSFVGEENDLIYRFLQVIIYAGGPVLVAGVLVAIAVAASR
jgi:hypothetical protein